MTFNVKDQAIIEDAYNKSLPTMPPRAPVSQRKATLPTCEHTFTRSILLIISFFFCYLFGGLAILFGRKIPANYKIPTKQIIDRALHSAKSTIGVKRIAQSRVVDLDYTPPPIDLMK